jgi:hypothetical protein
VVAEAAENVGIANGEYTQPTLTGTVQAPSFAELRRLNWHNFKSDSGANLWGDGATPTYPFLFIPEETRATT